MNRRDMLDNLRHLNLPIDQLRQAVGKLAWDSATEVVELTTADVQNVLARFEAAELNASQVEDWANLLEGRDDVGMTASVKQAIHLLANPAIEKPLTMHLAKAIRASLETSRKG
jgi:hypothetical protein